MSRLRQESGETLVSLLVNMVIMGIVFTVAIGHFFESSRRAFDHEIMTRTEEQARTLLDLMSFELRMAGSGMPLGQSNFVANTSGLGDTPLPVLPSSNNTRIELRLNEYGVSTVLLEDYTPGAGSLSFNVVSANDFEAGDTLYLSNMPAAGRDGLQGRITSVSGSTISIASDYRGSVGATFPAGSSVDRVTRVIFNSPSGTDGITRNAEVGTVTLTPESSFSAIYLDGAGNALGMPLTANTISQNLAAISLNVFVESSMPLRVGGNYVAQAQQTIALRNLNMNR